MRYETEKTRRRGHADTATDTLARGLGWFSIALGIVEVVAPRALARSLGMKGQEGLIAAYGLREIATESVSLPPRIRPLDLGARRRRRARSRTLATGLEGNNPRRAMWASPWRRSPA
jgi:hypothetical protein